jgi:cytoskeletal protein RodZ
VEFGRKLREERERQGYSLEAVEEETKIRKTYIKALEDEEFSLLPPQVYAVGFLKLYCNFLKLDSEEMVNEFKLIAYGQEEEKESLKVPTAKEYDFNWFSSKNLKRILTAGVFLLLIIWMGNSLVGYFANRGANEQTPPSPSVSEQPKENVKPPKVAVKQAKVVIDATQKCWLSVKVDDQQQFEGILLPGQTKSFTGKKSVLVNAGNAGGINITFNNKKLGTMGATGQVLEKVYKIE